MSSKRLNVITISVVVVAVLGFTFGLLLPGNRRLEELQNSIAAEQLAVAIKQAEVGDISGLYKDLVTLSDDVRTFRERLPTDRRLGEFLNELSDAMSKKGISDFNVQPLPATRVASDDLPERLRLANGTGVLPVQIAFRSDFKHAFELLDAIEVLPRLAYVERFQVEAVDELSGELNVTMVVQAFHHDHGQLLGNVPSSLTKLDESSSKTNG
ncbi:MAG: type 4a pilus biogenesis protein PilO [Phycisphaerales bacterium]|nr:type 4a pilus biogenesis protein PilO [Phycisphaerales bacterium]